tara:strand:- start:1398 stop:1784 length:387 start_codon:yes stop_codon:yes gene_type:complete
MESKLNYSNTEKVKDVIKHITRESFFRSLLNRTESAIRNFAVEATWPQSLFDDIKNDYKQRIIKGKVKVFYLDLVEHIVKELKNKAENPKSFFGVYNKSTSIKDINTYYRFLAYYQALVELNIDYKIN